MTTLERLQNEYQEADLHPRKTELVTEEETFIFFNEHFWLWPWLYGLVFIAAIIFLSVVGP
ncbi:MAG: hypothetical protein Q8934_22625 [Bacillota bacterium]|nr:hypothetical protein [Bacillota bacterium]